MLSSISYDHFSICRLSRLTFPFLRFLPIPRTFEPSNAKTEIRQKHTAMVDPDGMTISESISLSDDSRKSSVSFLFKIGESPSPNNGCNANIWGNCELTGRMTASKHHFECASRRKAVLFGHSPKMSYNFDTKFLTYFEVKTCFGLRFFGRFSVSTFVAYYRCESHYYRKLKIQISEYPIIRYSDFE